MAQAARLNLRMQKELKLLLNDPPPGASFPLLSADSDVSSLSTIHAQIEGPEGTVYAKGIFSIKIQIPERYPFQPPIVSFATPIYHPNIDNGGRICLDILNLPPKGAWQPSLNISTVLTSIGLLLSEPNPDDGLMCEASKEHKYNRQVFDQKARSMTEKYAKSGVSEHNHSTGGIEIKADSSTLMGIKSEKEPIYKTNASVSTHRKLCGISSKLSLGNSSSTDKRDNDVETNDNQNSHPLSDFNNHMEAKEDREDLRSMPDACTSKNEKLCNTRRKSSLESSLEYHKRGDHDTEVLEPKHSHSLFNPQVLSMVTPILHIGDNHEQHQHSKPTYGSKNSNSEPVTESLLIGSSSAHQPSQFHGKSTGPSHLSPSDNHDKLHSAKYSVGKVEEGSTDIKCKKINSLSKKLSLGIKSLSQKQEENKENILPNQKFHLPNSQTPRKTAIGGRQTFGPLFDLQGNNEENSQLISHLHKPSPDEKGEQTNRRHTGKTAGGTKRPKQESLEDESLIVLDSEDSEEESNRSESSKLSSIGKCMVRRKIRQP